VHQRLIAGTVMVAAELIDATHGVHHCDRQNQDETQMMSKLQIALRSDALCFL